MGRLTVAQLRLYLVTDEPGKGPPLKGKPVQNYAQVKAFVAETRAKAKAAKGKG